MRLGMNSVGSAILKYLWPRKKCSVDALIQNVPKWANRPPQIGSVQKEIDRLDKKLDGFGSDIQISFSSGTVELIKEPPS